MWTMVTLVHVETGRPGIGIIGVAGNHRPNKRRHSRSLKPRSPKCQTRGVTPLPDKPVWRNCPVAEGQSLQMADLPKYAGESSFANLGPTMPPQQPASSTLEQSAEASIPGPSSSEISPNACLFLQTSGREYYLRGLLRCP